MSVTPPGVRASAFPPYDSVRSLRATIPASFRMDTVPGLFDHDNDALTDMLGPARRLVVACDSRAADRKDDLVSYLDTARRRGRLEDFIVVDTVDDGETGIVGMAACDELVEAAVKIQLGRLDAFVAFGSERAGQVVAVTAASFRRHTSAIRIHRDLASVVASARDGVRVTMADGPISALQRDVRVIVDEDGLLTGEPPGPAEHGALLTLALIDRLALSGFLTGAPEEWRAEGLSAVLRLCRRIGPGSPIWRVGEAWSCLAPKQLDRSGRRIWAVSLAARAARSLDLLPGYVADDIVTFAARLDPEPAAAIPPDSAAVRRWCTGQRQLTGGALTAVLPTEDGADLVRVDLKEFEAVLTSHDGFPKAGAAAAVTGAAGVAAAAEVAWPAVERVTGGRSGAALSIPGGFAVRFTERLLDPDSAALTDLLPAGCQILALVDAYNPDQLWRVQRLLIGYQRDGYVSRFTVMPAAATDRAKTMDQVIRVIHAAEGLGLGPHDRIVVIGGGTVMDVAGYAAYLYRGDTPYIRVPTTLVGMIDAGIGLKVGVNVNNQKNLMGAYHPPLACVCDMEFLSTLPADELRCGLAEAVKIAAVCDARLFELIEVHHRDVAARRDTESVREILDRSICAMLRQLEANPFEADLRRLPDFGHEFGHVLESLSGYRLRHGEAVAIGMGLSCCLAAAAGYLPRGDLERLLALLGEIGLTLHDPVCDPDVLWRKLREDVIPHKAGRLHLVVPRSIGVGAFIDSIDELDPQMLHEACVELRAWTERDHDESAS